MKQLILTICSSSILGRDDLPHPLISDFRCIPDVWIHDCRLIRPQHCSTRCLYQGNSFSTCGEYTFLTLNLNRKFRHNWRRNIATFGNVLLPDLANSQLLVKATSPLLWGNDTVTSGNGSCSGLICKMASLNGTS